MLSSGDGFDCSRITICLTAIKCKWHISIPIVPVSSSFLRGLTPSCFAGSLLLYQSLIVFPDHWYPCFRNFDSVIPVNVIRVKPSVDNFLDSSSSISWNVMIYISREWIVRQAMKPLIIPTYTTRMSNNLFYCINSETVLNVSKHETCCFVQACQWGKLPEFCSLFFSWTVRMQVTADIYFTFCIFVSSFILSSGFLFNIW